MTVLSVAIVRPRATFMRIAIEPADQPEAIALIERLDAYQMPLYPAESHHGIDIAALSEPNVLFAVARDEQGRAVGCGAIVLEPDYGEIKRMFTLPSHRGRGIARSILVLLESGSQVGWAKTASVAGPPSPATNDEVGQRRGGLAHPTGLETGCLQPEAIALYERLGYARRGPFGPYMDDPNSVFMHKRAAEALVDPTT